MNLGKPCSVRLTEGLGRARTERNLRLSWLEATWLVAAEVDWMLGRTSLLCCSCIQLPSLNRLDGAAKRRSLPFWRPCEPLPILAAARVDAKVAVPFATTRSLPRTCTDKQPSDYPARGAIK